MFNGISLSKAQLGPDQLALNWFKLLLWFSNFGPHLIVRELFSILTSEQILARHMQDICGIALISPYLLGDE